VVVIMMVMVVMVVVVVVVVVVSLVMVGVVMNGSKTGTDNRADTLNMMLKQQWNT